MFLLNFWRSTIGKKVVMAVTGLIGVGFIVGHLLGNLQMFEGAEKMNGYAHFLKSLGGLLWLVRLVLIGAVILHVVAAYQLTRLRQQARPVGYASGGQREVSTLASRTIRWGGAFLLAFIVFHLLHFTTLTIFPSYSPTDVYGNVIQGFRIWWVALIYVVAMFFLGLHLYHGTWSSLRTIGAIRPSPNPLRRRLAAVVAALVSVGFIAIIIAVFTGVIGPATPRADDTAVTAAASSAAAK
ncbi:MAG: succinate dehydrogenase cytochrome b subunit [Gemmatimonadaceae bacterium]